MATPPLLKRLNEETVLDTIRSGAPISRAEIARRAGISKPTVSLALQTLLEAGLVRQAAEGPPGRRRGPGARTGGSRGRPARGERAGPRPQAVRRRARRAGPRSGQGRERRQTRRAGGGSPRRRARRRRIRLPLDRHRAWGGARVARRASARTSRRGG